MADELKVLQKKLCTSMTDFCRKCFENSTYKGQQNPPNVFRVGQNRNAKIFLVFAQPSNNNLLRNSPLVPITIVDPRRDFGSDSCHKNLIQLLRLLGYEDSTIDQLDSDLFHVTNAVKCDKCAITGETNMVEINKNQVRTCINEFFFQEVKLIQPKAIVFFGERPQLYVMETTTRIGEVSRWEIDQRLYWVMRVPSTSATPFNTVGGKGKNYIAWFQELEEQAGLME